MTTRLNLFFLFVSLSMGIICSIIVFFFIHQVDNHLLERRILVEYQEALTYFHENQTTNYVRLNSLTEAYKTISSLPSTVATMIEKESTADTSGWVKSQDSIYIYHNIVSEVPITIVSHVQPVEVRKKGFVIAVIIVFVVVLFFFSIFATILHRLSKSLIAPFNMLQTQLHNSQINTKQIFTVSEDVAVEFQTLVGKLNEYTQRINNLMQREQTFARYTSHELRTPLTLIKGASSLLEKRLPESFEKRQVNRIQDATNQIIDVVDATLSLVRYEKSENNVDFCIVTKEIIESIVEKNKHLIIKKEIAFNITIEKSIALQVPLVVVDIILSNILRNAITSMHSGNISITMTTSALLVTDEGVGLTSQSSSSEGYGLGLSIIEDVCRCYNWTFNLKNREEKGCIATITFYVR